MRPVERPLRNTLHSISRFRLVLPATFALAVMLVSLPAADEASAQGFGLQGFRKNVGSGANNGGNANFTATKKSSLTKKVSRPNGSAITLNKADTGPTGKGSLTGKGSGTNKGDGNVAGRDPGNKPKRPHPRWPDPIIPVIVDGTGGPPNLTNFSGGGSGSGPGNPIVSRRPGTGVPPANERSYVPDEVLIELAANTTDQTAEELARRHRLTQLESFDFNIAGTKLYRWRIQDPNRRTVPTVVRDLERTPGVISASANFISKLQQAPGSAADSTGPAEPNTSPIEQAPLAQAPLEQYALAKLQMPQAHGLARGNKVLIAIVDGGVDTSHPELAGVVVETFDAIGSGDKVHSHGTAIAGAIAAQLRLKGTAPAAQILAARAFGNERASSDGTGFNIAKAINWAVSRNARIINLSFAGARDPKVEVALKAARARGIVLVAAAGNDGPSSAPRYPAADPNVIAVTATDEDDKLFHAAVRGKHIAVAAPGVELWLPNVGGTYQEISGTSFSAAEVSGTVALMLERKPDLDPETVRRTLMSTARDLGPRGVDPLFGAGLVDAYKALMALKPETVGAAAAN